MQTREGFSHILVIWLKFQELSLKNDEQDWKVKTARQLKIHIFFMNIGTKELFRTDLLNRDEQYYLRT